MEDPDAGAEGIAGDASGGGPATVPEEAAVHTVDEDEV